MRARQCWSSKAIWMEGRQTGSSAFLWKARPCWGSRRARAPKYCRRGAERKEKVPARGTTRTPWWASTKATSAAATSGEGGRGSGADKSTRTSMLRLTSPLEDVWWREGGQGAKRGRREGQEGRETRERRRAGERKEKSRRGREEQEWAEEQE